MFEAWMDRVMKAKNNRLAYLRDLFYSHQKAGRFSFEPMKFPWLNPTQERAVNEVLWAKDVAIVHGPREPERQQPGGSHQRNPDARESGSGVCTEQHGGRLDIRKTGG